LYLSPITGLLIVLGSGAQGAVRVSVIQSCEVCLMLESWFARQGDRGEEGASVVLYEARAGDGATGLRRSVARKG
jgi:hypothetical protein